MSSSRGEEALTEKYPHYKTYKACQQQAFVSGSMTLLGVTACTYVIMDHWFKSRRPKLSKNWVLASSMIAGVLAAYTVTMSRSVTCQNMWMAMEERHSVLTTAEERLAQRIKPQQ